MVAVMKPKTRSELRAEREPSIPAPQDCWNARIRELEINIGSMALLATYIRETLESAPDSIETETAIRLADSIVGFNSRG